MAGRQVRNKRDDREPKYEKGFGCCQSFMKWLFVHFTGSENIITLLEKLKNYIRYYIILYSCENVCVKANIV